MPTDSKSAWSRACRWRPTSTHAMAGADEHEGMSAAPAAMPASPTLPPQAPATAIPWLGLLAVLMGTFISTLNGRLSNFGLADIRGAVGAGFDEGAWISTAQTVAQ